MKSGQRVVLKDNLKPTGRKVFLDDPSQVQLKFLYDMGHSFVEFVKDKPEEENKIIPAYVSESDEEPEETDSNKKPEKKIKIVKSGPDQS